MANFSKKISDCGTESLDFFLEHLNMFGHPPPVETKTEFERNGALLYSAQQPDLNHPDHMFNRLDLCIHKKEDRYFINGNYSKSDGAKGEISFDILAKNRDLIAVRMDFGLYLYGTPWDNVQTISIIQDSIINSLQDQNIKLQIDNLG
ncbi:MAG: hypothetical protein KME09_07255 [Pleurocapsa minor HA4230-MV1]|nr:hypothetical protein [Pleurocapsa minor HA4230-MV1]